MEQHVHSMHAVEKTALCHTGSAQRAMIQDLCSTGYGTIYAAAMQGDEQHAPVFAFVHAGMVGVEMHSALHASVASFPQHSNIRARTSNQSTRQRVSLGTPPDQFLPHRPIARQRIQDCRSHCGSARTRMCPSTACSLCQHAHNMQYCIPSQPLCSVLSSFEFPISYLRTSPPNLAHPNSLRQLCSCFPNTPPLQRGAHAHNPATGDSSTPQHAPCHQLVADLV
ncbi:hypothetical protein COO60DRAFT_310665 [Scenedesmus sp. NREL 46B-D3]|nr:hypothetical protein COO60DRAFT_310665 [Scenedesmus sp. NREL 46B-D3]